MALGTVRLLGLPLDAEGPEVLACSFPPLPAVGSTRRTNHSDLMLGLGGDQEVRLDIADVEHVDAWQDTTSGSVVLDGGAHDPIVRGGRRRPH
jgi:hypothetical protein